MKSWMNEMNRNEMKWNNEWNNEWMKWNDLSPIEMKRMNRMKWMKRNERKWNKTNDTKMKWHEMKRNETKWNDVTWNEKKRNEMKWYDVKWNEMNECMNERANQRIDEKKSDTQDYPFPLSQTIYVPSVWFVWILAFVRRHLVTLFVFPAKWPLERGQLRKRTKKWLTSDTQVTRKWHAGDTQVTRRQPIFKWPLRNPSDTQVTRSDTQKACDQPGTYAWLIL